MLAALCLRQPRRRWLRLKRRASAVQSEFVTVGSGRFLKITAEINRDGQPDWPDVRHAAGREAGRMLLPRGCCPPDESRIAAFDGHELCRKLMASAGEMLLRTVAVNPRLVRVAVYDPVGLMPDLPLLYLPYAADVRVVTGRPDRYAGRQYEAMSRFGAVLAVTSDTAALGGSLLVLAPAGLPDALATVTPRGLILSALPLQSGHKGVVDRYMPRVPSSYMAALPPGCDAERFLGGLYELSGLREIAAQPPEFLQMNGRMITLKDAAWRLMGIDIGLSV